MSNQKAVINLIRSISGQANVLTIPRLYITLTKSHRAALFLSQCVYWSDRGYDKDGWFYKTHKEWEHEIGLPRRGLETAIRNCGRWVETKVRRVGPTPMTHYRVNLELLVSDISEMLETSKSEMAENATSTMHRLQQRPTVRATREMLASPNPITHPNGYWSKEDLKAWGLE